MATQSGSAVEIVGSRGGSSNYESGFREGTAIFKVAFTDASAFAWEAENAVGIPLMGAQLGSTGLYVVEKSAKPDPNDQTIWMVEVKYRTLTTTEGRLQPNVNPTTSTWSVVKSIKSYPTEVPIQKDYNNKPVVNCLGEPMNPPVTAVAYDAQINISFVTTSTTHYSAIQSTLGKVNSDTGTITIGSDALIISAGQLFFQNYSDQEVYVQNGSTGTQTRASQFDYEFLWRGGGWAEQRPNLSLMWAPNGTSGTLSNGMVKCQGIASNCTDSAWVASNATTSGYLSGGGTMPEYITEPRYLDADGKIIPNGGTIVLNSFTTKGTASFFTGLLSLLSG